MSELKAAAIAYAKAGFAVFPCERDSKEPATIRGFKDAVKDPQVVERVWNDYPDNNIGIATGGMSGGLSGMAGWLEKKQHALENKASGVTKIDGKAGDAE